MPAGQHRPHVAVVDRPVPGGSIPSLVFPELLEGRYDLVPKGTDDVRLSGGGRGGEVTLADWPSVRPRERRRSTASCASTRPCDVPRREPEVARLGDRVRALPARGAQAPLTVPPLGGDVAGFRLVSRSVAERLAGQHVLLTGVTGFVGEALLHLLLTEVPDLRMSVLVRPKGSTPRLGRVAKLLEKPIFADVRRGGRRRREADGRAGRGRRGRPGRRTRAARPTSTRSCTAPATCPSTRRSTRGSPPTSSAPATCSTGSTRPAGRPAATSTTCTSPRRTSRAGAAAASPRRRSSTTSTSRPSWRGGWRSARTVEHRSRGVERAGQGAQEGREGAQPGRAAHRRPRHRGGPQAVGQGRAGPDRHRAGAAASAGPTATPSPRRWASGSSSAGPGRPGHRRAPPRLDRPAEHHRVRPRAAARRLDRGVQDGRAADPGLRPRRAAGVPVRAGHHRRHRPGRPVVSAIVAVLAHPPEPGEVGYFHVSSGDRNPLTFNVLYTSVREYFDHHPFTHGDRGAARLPDWRFPGARSVERLLSTSEKAWKVADYVVGHAPRSDRARDLARKLAPAGPPAGVPAPLPRPLHGVRHRRAALLRPADDGALRARSPRPTARPSPSTPR